MKILALDTSTRALSLALGVKDLESGAFEILARMTEVLEGQHGETLAPQVQVLMEGLGWLMPEIEAVIVGIGPGSYTGLRIGVTFAKTLAYALKIPVYAISSLALMAAAVSESTEGDIRSNWVIPIMDARRGTAYTGLYQQGQPAPVVADLHTDFASWFESLDLTGRVTLVGTDIQEFVEIAQAGYPQVEVITGEAAYPDVSQALSGARNGLLEVADINLLVPNYAHETLAEQEWRAGHQQSQEAGSSSSPDPKQGGQASTSASSLDSANLIDTTSTNSDDLFQ